MKKKFLTVVCFFLTFSFLPVSFTQHEHKSTIHLGQTKAESLAPITTGIKNAATAENKQLTARLDRYIEKQLALDTFHGTVLIAKGDTILLKKGYGYAYQKTKEPNRPEHKFAMGSLTKSFTAMAILQLHEKGALNIYEPINRFFPTYPFAKRVTIHHLLTHSSGLPMNKGDKKYEELTLMYPPGTKQNYSNEGYILMGRIIEQASGLAYDAYITSHIFGPLHMDASGFNLSQRSVLDRARGHKKVHGNWVALGMNYGTRFSSGGLYSTVEDLYKWDRALYTDTLLARSLRDKMLTQQMKQYGYGWHIEERHGRKLAGHGGYVLGFSAEIVRDTTSKNVVILLSNHSDIGLKDMGLTLLDMLEEPTNPNGKSNAKKKPLV
ncbi:serine hydrolase domain-containing protein [Aneurinibacillus sp. REN35]|uniref:serine hydrolase domain-containing protein n=1 Tax=Aneurinibacillus sp. REN35 TaxID=3237286 RepID=UPI003527FFDE